MRLPIDLPDDLYEWLRETAFRQRKSMASIVREALQAYRERAQGQASERPWEKQR